MKKRPIISRTGKPRAADDGRWLALDDAAPAFITPPRHDEPPLRQRIGARWTGFYGRHQGPLLVAISVATTLALVGLYQLVQPAPQRLTQPQLSAAVNFAVDERPRPPSVSSVAYAKIIGSVVRVNGFDPGSDEPDATPGAGDDGEAGPPPAPGAAPKAQEAGVDEDYHKRFSAVGTGVVIDEDGTILTNLHVAAAAPSLRVIFHDGTESDALIVGAQPENDLAVIRPDVLPDDLMPATLASTANLRPGDDVLAVGFPFGIGPSASAGVVSGLKRQFDEDGARTIGNLIQFDAAANPGNSGGPLVNADGEVVGIVTAIVNPSGVRTFAGIGFAVPIENAMGGFGESPL